ncbi:RING finger protein B-like [Diaphorina citri]|uniref:RING finger protein B-like n=1 Tax=Diaphorina citri TaxID=121845 RepID=A0A3Q0ILS8_DIACI|nr:RING finger protein B-like [Diaphorina citri]
MSSLSETGSFRNLAVAIGPHTDEGMLATPQAPAPHPLNLKSNPEAVEESGDEDSCSSSGASSCTDSTGNEQNKFNGINLSNMPGIISPPLISQNQNMVNAPLNLSLNSNAVSANFHPNVNPRTDLKNPSAGSTLPATNMPHFILASGQLVQGIQGAQLLIPTTQGITTQTILTIPVNNVTSNQPVNLALNNGQVISTTIANLQSMAQPNPLFNNNGAVSPNTQQQQQQQSHQQPSSLSTSAQQLLASALTSINLASMNNHQRSLTTVPSHPSLSSHHQRTPSYHTNSHPYQNNLSKSPHHEPNNNTTTSTPLTHIPSKPASPPHLKSSLGLNNNNLSSNNNLRRSLSPTAAPASLPPANSPLNRLTTHNGELTITTTNSNKYDYASSERPDSPDDLSDEPMGIF